MPDSVDFVGAGWSFPLGTDATGGIALVVGDREIEQAIRIILGTAPGERPMRPEFGCRIHDHVFGEMNNATAGAIAFDVRSALEQWEPRIDVDEVTVTFGSHDLGRVDINVSYSVRSYNDRRNLVYPFYVIPDEAASTGVLPPRPVVPFDAVPYSEKPYPIPENERTG
jgi:uncharacterized protein